MATPLLCPLFMQARASIPELVYNGEEYNQGPAACATTSGAFYPDPSQAPGVACIGSRCAAWVRLPAGDGRCGAFASAVITFDDPAATTGGRS